MSGQNLAVLLREREAEIEFLRHRCYTLGLALDAVSAQLAQATAGDESLPDATATDPNAGLPACA